MFVHYVAIWSILRPLGIFCGNPVYFMAISYIFPPLCMLHQEKSGNGIFDSQCVRTKKFRNAPKEILIENLTPFRECN
jgi:hypothetical protein